MESVAYRCNLSVVCESEGAKYDEKSWTLQYQAIHARLQSVSSSAASDALSARTLGDQLFRDHLELFKNRPRKRKKHGQREHHRFAWLHLFFD